MHILRDLISPLQHVFNRSFLGQRRAVWFCLTLLTIIIPFTSSISSNLLRSLNTFFGLKIDQSSFYRFMGSANLPWNGLWLCVWSHIRQPKTEGRLLLALDDFINPKSGQKIFGCGRTFDHAAKSNQTAYPWAQCVVNVGLLKVIKNRWAYLPLGSKFYIKEKDIDAAVINAHVRGKVVAFETKLAQAAGMIDQIVSHFACPTLVVGDSWFGNNGLWRLIKDNRHSVDLLSRLRSKFVLHDFAPAVATTEKPRGRPRKYGARLGSVAELAISFRSSARDHVTTLYGKKQHQLIYDRVVMLKTLQCPVRVVWIYRHSRYVALFTTDLTLSCEQIIEYNAARWKIEAAFKELKQEIGSARSQTRDAYAVSNHLQMCLMAATITRLVFIISCDPFHFQSSFVHCTVP